MRVEYTHKLRRKLKDENTIIKSYGSKIGIKIIRRLNELVAFTSLWNVPETRPTRRHLLEPHKDEIFSIDLTENYRLLIKPKDSIYLSDGSLDLKSITGIEIVDIKDTH